MAQQLSSNSEGHRKLELMPSDIDNWLEDGKLGIEERYGDGELCQPV